MVQVLSGSIPPDQDTIVYDASGLLSAPAIVPIGGLIPFCKNLSGVPTPDERFVECNGQVLSDADSPLDGQTMPALNNTPFFLRGASTSGGTGGSDTKDLSHLHFTTIPGDAGGAVGGASPAHSGTYGSSTEGSTTQDILPAYYNVVFLIRVK